MAPGGLNAPSWRRLNTKRQLAGRTFCNVALALLNPRIRSLARGNTIVLSCLLIATLISRAPHLRATPLLLLPMIGAMVGMADTVRCMRKRWDFYHAGVLLCLYMDLMAITMVLFYLVYPYLVGLGEAH